MYESAGEAKLLWLPFAAAFVGIDAEQNFPLPASQQFALKQILERSLGEAVQIEDVNVVGRRGSALMTSEIELGRSEIEAFGVWDVGEVIRRLVSAYSLGDEPIVIINGKPSASSAAFFGFPPDALVRAEVLPAGAAEIYGGPAGRRVVNLVFQERFASYDGRLSQAMPTQGGNTYRSGDLRRSTIVADSVRQLGLRISADTALRSDQRSRDLPGDGVDLGAVTLRPQVNAIAANASFSRPLGTWSSVLSTNGQVRESRSIVRQSGELATSRDQSASLNAVASVSGFASGWSLRGSVAGQASAFQGNGLTETLNMNQSLAVNASGSRNVANLRTGPVVVNIGVNLSENRSIVDRREMRVMANFGVQEGRGSLVVPVSRASNSAAISRVLGDSQLTFGAAFKETSVGGGGDLSSSFALAPKKWLRVSGTWAVSTDIVNDAQRFEPPYRDAPRVVFDFRSGKAVEIIPIFGGNPQLRQPRSGRRSLAVAVGPLTPWELSGGVSYQRVASIDGISSLPDLTDDIEVAFPDRFERDIGGTLVSIDYRPLNSRANLTESLTSNLSVSLPKSSGIATNEAIVFRASLNYNLRLRSTVSLVEGLASLNRLTGDGGAVSRQDLSATLDARRAGWTANASVRWQDGYRIRRFTGRDDRRDFVKKPYATLDLRFSVPLNTMQFQNMEPSLAGELGALNRKPSINSRLSFEFENLLDARPKAHLGDGAPAPGYSRDIQDPIGRKFRVTLQRRF